MLCFASSSDSESESESESEASLKSEELSFVVGLGLFSTSGITVSPSSSSGDCC